MLLHQPAALRVHQHSRSSNIHAPKFARSPCLKQNPCCSAWFQKQSVVMPQVLRQQASRPAKTSHLSASSRDDLNPVEVVKREAALASNRLSDSVRDKVQSAIEALGYRVTTGDVVARAGVKLSQADEALQALCCDSQGALEVSPEGDVVYVFAKDFRSKITNRSLYLRAKPILGKIAKAAGYLSRLAFGASLFGSVALVYLAITVVLSQRDSDNRDRRGGGGFGGGGGYYGGGPRMFIDVADLLLWLNPSYRRSYVVVPRQRRERARDRWGREKEAEPEEEEEVLQPREMSFIESIFSFVFGDENPNESFEELQWKRLAAMIKAKGGVVTAEEMAPFLDAPAPRTPRDGDDSPYYPDEGFVLPALLKFGGEASVDEKGHLLYTFASLQRSGVEGKAAMSRAAATLPTNISVPLEQPFKQTEATPGQVAGASFLGGANVVGVAFLANLLLEPRTQYILSVQGLGFIVGLMPILAAYATSFFAVPAIRWFINLRRNGELEQRNERRVQSANILANSSSGRSSADALVREKLASARRAGVSKVLSAGDAIYSSALTEDGERELATKDLKDFDQVLQRGGGW